MHMTIYIHIYIQYIYLHAYDMHMTILDFYIYFLLSSCLLENRIPVTFIIAQILLSLCILTTQL